MALFRVASPDGAVYDVTAPDDATQDEVLARAQAFHAASTAAPPAPTAFQNANVNAANQLLQEPRVRAFLGALGNAESGNRYNVIVGGGTFDDYSRHPNIKVGKSTEAGAYQFNNGTWGDEVKRLGLTDFSPASQDIAAVDLLNRLGALPKLLSNDVDGAVFSAAQRWESLPQDYSQRSRNGAVRSLGGFRNDYFGRLR
ncbi:MAG: glycoside hydrolase family 104 protein [Alphaproteobacteria bacterium]|nr:glycoside hydrolase family 104 protein [Alphaproteobacteria bacterium]